MFKELLEEELVTEAQQKELEKITKELSDLTKRFKKIKGKLSKIDKKGTEKTFEALFTADQFMDELYYSIV